MQVLSRVGLKQGAGGDEAGPTSARGTWHFQDTKQNTKYFTWMSEKKCVESNVNLRAPKEIDEVSGLVQAPIGYDEETLTNTLKDHGILVDKFGQKGTRTLKEFSNELIKGESSLMKDKDDKLVRIVDIVLLRLTKAGTKELLIETGEVRQEGTISHNRLPGSKRRPDENQFVTARRILRRQLMWVRTMSISTPKMYKSWRRRRLHHLTPVCQPSTASASSRERSPDLMRRKFLLIEAHRLNHLRRTARHPAHGALKGLPCCKDQAYEPDALRGRKCCKDRTPVHV